MQAAGVVRACAVAGMVASLVWVVALVAEYPLALRLLGNGSASDDAYQAVFLIAQIGYLALLVGMFRSQAGGSGLGRLAIVMWAIAMAEIVLARGAILFGFDPRSWLPGASLFQLLGAVLTSIAVWRGGRWTGWRRLAPAIWTSYFLVRAGAVLAAIPIVSDSISGHRVPSTFSEALLQGFWFLLAFALYIEAGRTAIPASAPA
jgi:hypothetical protein